VLVPRRPQHLNTKPLCRSDDSLEIFAACSPWMDFSCCCAPDTAKRDIDSPQCTVLCAVYINPVCHATTVTIVCGEAGCIVLCFPNQPKAQVHAGNPCVVPICSVCNYNMHAPQDGPSPHLDLSPAARLKMVGL
jgi:hypothetical protein